MTPRRLILGPGLLILLALLVVLALTCTRQPAAAPPSTVTPTIYVFVLPAAPPPATPTPREVPPVVEKLPTKGATFTPTPRLTETATPEPTSTRVPQTPVQRGELWSG